MARQPQRPTAARAPRGTQRSLPPSARAAGLATPQAQTDAFLGPADSNSDRSVSSDPDSGSDSSSDSESDESSSSESASDTEEDSVGIDLDALAAEATESLSQERAARFAAARDTVGSADMIGLADAAGPADGAEAGPVTGPAPKEEAEQIKALAAQYSAAHPSLGETMAERSVRGLEGSDRTHLDAALPKKTARKVRAAERAQTAGSRWYGMPAVMPDQGNLASRSLVGPSTTSVARSDRSMLTKGGSAAVGGDARGLTAAEIRRELVAIRLRNAMDPKRFFRGHQKKLDIPPYAQIGTVIASAFAPKQQLGRGERGRSVVDEVMRDSTATEYARRKATQLNSARTPQGRIKYRTKGKKKKSSGQR